MNWLVFLYFIHLVFYYSNFFYIWPQNTTLVATLKKVEWNIFYCEIILNRGCQCSGVATIFLVRGGSHKFLSLWGRNVIGSKFYFVKKNTKQMLVCTLVGRKIRVQGLPTKDGTLVSHEHLWFHSILLKISDNANFKCWSVLRQNFFFTF